MFGFLVRLMFRVIRFLLPWSIQLLRLVVNLMLTAITSIYVGIPTAIERIADSWTAQAAQAGLPQSFQPALRTGAKVAASISLILGWLLLASLTVWIGRLLFFQ